MLNSDTPLSFINFGIDMKSVMDEMGENSYSKTLDTEKYIEEGKLKNKLKKRIFDDYRDFSYKNVYRKIFCLILFVYLTSSFYIFM